MENIIQKSFLALVLVEHDMVLVINQPIVPSSRARKNDDREAITTVIPDSVLSNNLFP